MGTKRQSMMSTAFKGSSLKLPPNPSIFTLLARTWPHGTANYKEGWDLQSLYWAIILKDPVSVILWEDRHWGVSGRLCQGPS